MTFKELISSDLDVFLNESEFGEKHTINGVEQTVTIDNDKLQERSKKEYDGVSVGELLIYVRPSAFSKRPEEGTPLVFDGRQMYVFDCREDDGLYEIILRQNRGV